MKKAPASVCIYDSYINIKSIPSIFLIHALLFRRSNSFLPLNLECMTKSVPFLLPKTNTLNEQDEWHLNKREKEEKYVGEKLLSIFFLLRFPLHFHMTNTFCRTIIVKVAKSRSCHFENYIITFACKKALCGELDYEGAKEARGE